MHAIDEDQYFQNLIGNSKQLPTLPGIALKLLEAIQKEDSNIREIGKILSTDPPLSGAILKMINSSFYGLATKITTVTHAVNLLGLRAVKNLALSFSLVKTFRSEGSSPIDYQQLWKNSLTAAISAKLIAQIMKPKLAEDAFFLGLLHDIGILTLSRCISRQYNLVMSEGGSYLNSIHRFEDSILTFNHMNIGKYIVKSWQLPQYFYEPIGFHHNPFLLQNEDRDITDLTHILYVATLFIDLFSSEEKGIAFGKLESAFDQYGYSEKVDIEDIGRQVEEQTKTVFPLFEVTCDTTTDYDHIIETAHLELSKLNEEVLRQLALQELKIQELAERVTRDGMTELINYQFFHEMLEKEIDNARNNHEHLSIILGDIDKFKSINDTYGHLAGDRAIIEVAHCLKKLLRETNYAARYGGEEFALLLLKTPASTALKVAELLREAIGSSRISFGENTFSLTMSFGVASFDPSGNNDISKETLIHHADMALYNAKGNGRNQCCLF